MRPTVHTLAKLVVVDLAGIEGIWRALSFICVGGVLMAIGGVDQRDVFAPRSFPI